MGKQTLPVLQVFFTSQESSSTAYTSCVAFSCLFLNRCVSANFSLCILYDISSDLSLRTERCFDLLRFQLMEKYSIELSSDTRLFCSKGLFMKWERVHVRIERVHLYKTQWEKLCRQTGPGC